MCSSDLTPRQLWTGTTGPTGTPQLSRLISAYRGKARSDNKPIESASEHRRRREGGHVSERRQRAICYTQRLLRRVFEDADDTLRKARNNEPETTCSHFARWPRIAFWQAKGKKNLSRRAKRACVSHRPGGSVSLDSRRCFLKSNPDSRQL